MHIKAGTWEASSIVCESDALCGPAALVSATDPEPHIRNRRLSPGSSYCGGGGGCISREDRQHSPEGDLIVPGQTHTFSFRREKERKGQPHKGRGPRRENQGRGSERPQKTAHKDRWVEDSLSSLKPPPAFPVRDSPAKLQPAVSYASKVKAGAANGALEEERPAIGMLLQNQWGLSFISEAGPATQGLETVLTAQPPEEAPPPIAAPVTPATHPGVDQSNGKLLLTCRHLVEALNYHSREWNAVCNKQKRVPKKVVWYQDSQEHPA
ncbi:uncharacterized protein si:ch211-214j24.10 [Brachionichthys hirsutus]|uniref:uncharacterized protein si:ch211-214j24.10 n=1 Tax=Brachionichthys hirsutus TaxID=412623 RepID=UPI0036046DC3